MADFEKIVRRFLDQAEVQINGNCPWDIKVHNSEFYRRAILQGTLGLGESYMDGWWNCEALDQLFYRLIRADLHKKVHVPWIEKISFLANKISNRQTRRRSRKVIDSHYDPGSDIILAFLDPYNQYTCGYFEGTDNLNKAQEQKLDLICRKLMLTEKDKVLDIGCGWGGFARFATERFGCEVTGISISSEQIEYAKNFCDGLPVHFVFSDYRDFRGSFKKILICGMIEHVGYKNYRKLLRMVHECLEKDGLFLLHTIGGNTSVISNDPWVGRYIFPNSMLPSLEQIMNAVDGLFVLEDLHNFGQYYDPTLMAWHQNFVRTWPVFRSRFDERFFRMWNYYFLHLAGAFRARKNQLWQFVFSRNGILGGYRSSR